MIDRVPVTKVEEWIRKKIGSQGRRLTREELNQYQMEQLQKTLEFVMKNSPFYKKKYSGHPLKSIRTLEDIHKLPFTEASDIRRSPMEFVCVSQSKISRIVTLKTSGTTSSPKRIFFTEDDLELTRDYFAHAMAEFVTSGRKVIIFMPGTQPESIGQLISGGLKRIGVEDIVSGPVTDMEKALELINDLKPECIIGIPTQMLQLARSGNAATRSENSVKNVILSADYVPSAIARAIESAWRCRVFSHYGMTEMGYAGGVECLAVNGYHFREADLYLEIIDPVSGYPISDGEYGEVVFTTLTRRGMPLIRYRTGDIARFLKSPCPCNTVLKQMEPVKGRLTGRVSLKDGSVFGIGELDEALFSVPELLNYNAEISEKDGTDLLKVSILTKPEGSKTAIDAAENMVSEIPAIKEAMGSGKLTIERFSTDCKPPVSSGMIKRTLTDTRKSR